MVLDANHRIERRGRREFEHAIKERCFHIGTSDDAVVHRFCQAKEFKHA